MEFVITWIAEHLRLIILFFCVVFETIYFRRVQDLTPQKTWMTIVMMVILNVYAIVTGNSFGMIEKWSLEGFQILRMSGSILMMPFAIFMVAKLFKWKNTVAFDVLAIAFAIGLILMRFNCVLHGCCTSIAIPALGGIFLPIRLLEMAMFALFIFRYQSKVSRGETYGEIYPLLLIWYGAFRFVIEWFRDEYVLAFGKIHWAHIWSIISLVIGLAVYGELRRRHDSTAPKKRRKNV